jgi:hypothetical protein
VGQVGVDLLRPWGGDVAGDEGGEGLRHREVPFI